MKKEKNKKSWIGNRIKDDRMLVLRESLQFNSTLKSLKIDYAHDLVTDGLMEVDTMMTTIDMRSDKGRENM